MYIAILQHALLYGAILSVLMFFIIFGSLYYNPELWLHDFPKDIQERYGPASEKTRREKKWFGPFFLLVVLGVFVASLVQLPRVTGAPLTFPAAFLDVFVIYMFFNLVDLLIFDWLIALTLRPKFMILPGTEGARGYYDYGFHLRGFLKGTLGGVFISLALAGIAALAASARGIG